MFRHGFCFHDVVSFPTHVDRRTQGWRILEIEPGPENVEI